MFARKLKQTKNSYLGWDINRLYGSHQKLFVLFFFVLISIKHI